MARRYFFAFSKPMENSNYNLCLPRFDSSLCFNQSCRKMWFSFVCTNLSQRFPALKNVRISKKRVLDEITDKQKAAPRKAFLPPSELLCLCFFIISELEKVVK